MDKTAVHVSLLRQHAPDTLIAQAAWDYASEALPPAILNHSLRVFLLAEWLAKRENSHYATEARSALFVACIFHDFGATEPHNHAERFEVCGADAAVDFLKNAQKAEERTADQDKDESQTPWFEIPDARGIWDIWTAIALHTSAGIAERIHPLPRLVRLAVLMDFREATRKQLDAVEYSAQLDKDIPRLNIEKILGDVVVEQALTKDEGEARAVKAPAASWPGILLKSHIEDPTWEGINKAF